MFTPGNVDDRQPLYSESFIEKVKGKHCGDKGYLSKQLFEFLFMNSIQLMTKIKSNMRNSLMSPAVFPQETFYILGFRFRQSVDFVLMPYVELTLKKQSGTTFQYIRAS